MSLWNFFLNLIYPENCHCFKCRKNYIFSELKGICNDCLEEIEFFQKNCLICGRGIFDSGKNHCTYCQEKGFYYDLGRSAGSYSGLLKYLILEFKYGHNLSLSAPLGQILFYTYQQYYINEYIDEIIYVPIHKQRYKERGFNQSGLLADILSKKTGIPVNKSLKRLKETPPLYNYSFHERENILKDSFILDNDVFKGKVLLLVDDIMTTGATANEISRLLKETGKARKVFLLTVATSLTY
ncbi:MAG: ComF family protein [Bacillota bacterium]